MVITCIGHSGFAIETEDATLIFDYFHDEQHVLPAILQRAKRIYVFVTHGHQDHLNRDEILDWHKQYPVEQYIMANGCRHKIRHAMKSNPIPATFIHHDEDYSSPVMKVHTFDSTDVGVCFIVNIGGKTIFHAGDFNCWHWKDNSTQQEVKKAVGDFRAILRTIAAHTQVIDVAMFPVDPAMGTDFGMGAREFVHAIDVKLFIPMHMWGRDEQATQFHLYRNLEHGEYLHLPPGHSITID